MNGCIICGNPKTVKSHLMPRSLMLDIRGDDTKLYEGNRDVEGVNYRQNGYWDRNLLCEHHEKESGWGDDYAIQFIRKFFSTAKLSETGNSWELDNPNPDRLMHFAYSVVWKHAVSQHGKRHNLKLGKYEPILRNSIFEKSGFDQQLLIGDPNITANGESIRNIALAPYRQKLQDWNSWHFIVGGLEFFLKLDQRRFPKVWEPYLANENTKLVVSKSNPKDLKDVRLFDSIISNMFAK